MDEVIVIVLNWNGQKYIKECLSSIIKNTIHENYSLCLVDNGSDDKSVKIARDNFPAVEIIENEKNLGFSIGNNIGIYENKKYDKYVLLNSDTRVKEGWIKKMLEVFEKGEKVGICGSKIMNHDETIESAGVDTTEMINIKDDKNVDRKNYRKVDGVLGASMMIDKNLIEDIGYLDEIYSPMQHEESDYCCRARKSGYSVYVAYESQVVHYGGRSKKDVPSDFEKLCNLKNILKYRISNSSINLFFYDLYKYTRLYFSSHLKGSGTYPLNVYLKAIIEIAKDLPYLIRRRIDRSAFVTSYYCKGLYDFSKRYR